MNKTQEIHIRKAKPEIVEGLIFAELLDKTAEGFFSKLLGKEAYEIIAEAFCEPNNEYSFENVIFADNGNTICGMASGYTYNMNQNFKKDILDQTTKGRKGNIRRFQFIGSILKRFMGVKQSGEYYLQAIIVEDNYRGMGLGRKLMNWIDEVAGVKGSRLIALDVSRKNNEAIRLYQRQGMTIESRRSRFPFFLSPFTRMSKEL